MHDSLITMAQRILKKHFDASSVDVKWEYSKEEGHGDLSTSVALQCAKELKKNPKEIADILVEELKKEEGIENAEMAGAGYVNIWLSASVLLKQLNETRTACTAKVKRKGPPVIIDYSAPNIAKPLGIHHILSTVIGQSLKNLFVHTGIDAIGWNYLGDWGTQFGKLAVAYEKWGEGNPVSEMDIDELLALYVRFHAEVESDPSLEDDARATFKKLEGGDKELRAFWKNIVEVSKQDLDKLYERLHVTFDKEIGESFYEDKMEAIIKEGVEKKVFTEGEEGALIVEFPEESNLSPYMMRKSDGSTLYSTRDMAQVRYRIDEFKPESILYVVDVAQKLHFEQLFATCEQIEWKLPQLEHVIFGRMKFKDQQMSTRKGTALKLEEVLDEAVRRADKVIAEHGDSIQTDDSEELGQMMGVGSLVYGILSQNRKMDIVFDWDKYLSFDGNSAPYLQYTHARARSVLRKADREEVDVPEEVENLTDKERSLVNVLLQFEKVLLQARDTRMPHILTNYLFALCQEYNAFYNSEPILKAEEPARTLRLCLTSLTASVLKTGAEILTIRVPDRM
ncbi:arginine--tRNA ligase [Patescibacteria group bacterium]|nr:arginine--tRNA ligase [Patescibacteria group bacterium]